mmetsp:Transcript_9495/g.26243  ORF Transcript_9495/g.26243 Transcript_9495/m.26243 type:complete len:96 (-) Transcript_9495:2469-2756(-)
MVSLSLHGVEVLSGVGLVGGCLAEKPVLFQSHCEIQNLKAAQTQTAVIAKNPKLSHSSFLPHTPWMRVTTARVDREREQRRILVQTTRPSHNTPC